MWLVDYQHMNKDSYIDFENYKSLVTGKLDRSVSAKDILKESEEILKFTEAKKRGEGIGIRNI